MRALPATAPPFGGERRLLARSGHAASTLFKFACAGPRLIDAYALFHMRNPPIVIP
jgi:hypothetical protein